MPRYTGGHGDPGLCGVTPERDLGLHPTRVVERTRLDELHARHGLYVAVELSAAVRTEETGHVITARSLYGVPLRFTLLGAKGRIGNEAERRKGTSRRTLAILAVAMTLPRDPTTVDLVADVST